MDCYSADYSCPGGYEAKVYVRYDVETWYDYFYIYDSNIGASTPYSGNSSGYVWLTSNARSVRFRFTSDESINRWGVDVDKIDCYIETSTTTSTSSPTTTVLGPCAMKGNDPPCDVIRLAEVVDAINQWIAGSLGIGEVIDIINSWADPANYPPA
jgi:hypothetical protein